MSKDKPWPNWEEPASKGDLLMMASATRGCMINLMSMATAAAKSPPDPQKLLDALGEFATSFEEMRTIMDQVGGADPDGE